MKKTKIIIPALAALCLGAVASVSGTLAWFSASKSKSISMQNIAVINTQGSLVGEVAAGKNSKVAEGGNVALADGYRLRDASAQIGKSATDNVTVWEATNVSDAGIATKYQSVDSSFVYNSAKKIAYAATFELTFTINGNDTTKYDVMFDAVNSSVTPKSGDVSAIHNAFRLGMYNADQLIVWNNLAGDDTLTYVNSATTTASYTRTKTDAKIGEIFAKDSGESTTEAKVYCVIWYDGTDAAAVSSVLNEGITSSMTSELKFYAVEHVEA